MVKAELIYNPYLMKTKVRFNDQPPRINSLVEKYEGEFLQSWISKVPQIFHDEMNGYDFDLDFSGTKTDFIELQKTFQKSGVSEDEVRLHYKNELDDRNIKRLDIDELLDWLSQNRNHRFSYEEFRAINRELFDDSFPYIILHGAGMDIAPLKNTELGVEAIEDVNDLIPTVLENTPIVVCMTDDSLPYLEKDMGFLLGRNDISQEQLFFWIADELNPDYVIRMISDLGVKDPQIVKELSDIKIVHYFELYPLSDYIHQAIIKFRELADPLHEKLKEEAERSAIKNQKVYLELDKLEEMLQKLKLAKNEFIDRDNVQNPLEWTEAKQNLLYSIRFWRERKTMMTHAEDAQIAAYEFEQDVVRLFGNYVSRIQKSFEDVRHALADDYHKIFSKAGVGMSEDKTEIRIQNIDLPSIPLFSTKLMELKTERYVQPQKEIFSFFKSQDNTKSEPVLQTVFSYQEWRMCVLSLIEPIANEVYNAYADLYRKYDQELADVFIQYIDNWTEHYQNRKDEVSSQLSGEEHILQEDKDWVTSFLDRIQHIEEH